MTSTFIPTTRVTAFTEPPCNFKSIESQLPAIRDLVNNSQSLNPVLSEMARPAVMLRQASSLVAFEKQLPEGVRLKALN